MKHQVLVSATWAALVAAIAGCTTPPVAPAPAVPDTLKPSRAEVLSLEIAATGVQIYECAAATGAPRRYEWVFRAPEADLFDRAGRRIGTHYAGPTWELADGSRVMGEVKARNDAPRPGAIPWLLLQAKSATGNGALTRTTSIQRVDTVGGVTPAEPCSEAQAGKVARVAYEATYYFYAGNP